MNKKLVLALFVSAFLIVGGVFAFETTTLANGNPATSPSTSPISAAIYKVTGRVKKAVLLQKLTKPIKYWVGVKNVKVTAVNKNTNETFETYTDLNGNYSFDLTKGLYIFVPSRKGSSFLPTQRQSYIDSDTSITDFVLNK